ncbi:MAG: UDP-N-acetyl-D-glucosamine dehydrogenase [Nitrospinae bacterium RIFCSPLOWO2_01_FULL_39_10]|nr:MAG: UDP-N-acetyl-D-glucosamine dehydrogenase [Nitrospinae bacterium RIFCSPLOWO2_01_FULL_39_10]
MENLSDKIKNKTAKVSIIGLGYVGLPLSIEFCKSGFTVIGIDVDKSKVDALKKGESYVQDVKDDDVKLFIKNKKFIPTTHFSLLKDADTVSICVPTPLRKTRDPDISYIVSAASEIKKYLHKGQLIVLESTTYPGTTDEVLLPELEATGLKVGVDFYLAFSPERVDPGNKKYHTKNTPKIIGGVTTECTNIAKSLYEQSIDTVIPVSSTRSAEMVKLLENTFRAVNIGLVNEIAIMCDRLGMDVWEVIDAASTKPFGFMPFYPGPGLGGHCIPIDPLYLSWKLKTLNYTARFIELASEINTGMPLYVVSKVVDALNEKKKSVNGAKILILGVTYKRDVGDVRESPAIDVIKYLKNKGADVSFHDPYVDSIHEIDNVKKVELREDVLAKADCVVIVTDHSKFDYKWIVKNSKLVVDTRNTTKDIIEGREKIVKL